MAFICGKVESLKYGDKRFLLDTDDQKNKIIIIIIATILTVYVPSEFCPLGVKVSDPP